MTRRKRGGFTLIELMIAVAIVAILAATAIPAFMRYIRKSKTTEARQMLRQLHGAARIYYLETHANQHTGAVVSHEFPQTVAATPAVTCCAGAGSGKCPPVAADWAAPTWTVLHFSMVDHHYYRYEFISSGTATTAKFTARALGDLDCDTTESTFEIFGRVVDGGADIEGGGNIARIRELE